MNCTPTDMLAHDTMVRELLRPLLRYLALPGATEIVINRPQEVHIEIGAAWQHHRSPDLTLDRLTALATAIATATEQEIGPHHPILSAMLPDGERVQIVLPPAVELGTVSISIRRPSAWIKTLAEYDAEGAFSRYVWARAATLDRRAVELDSIERQLVQYLTTRQLDLFIRAAVLAKKNIAVVGDTGSGKTTLMKSICQVVPEQERLITIEDVRELLLPRHGNRVHLLYAKGGQGTARVSPSELIASTLRMKPDRVLLAELRGGEAFDFLKLLTIGHSGSITSYHAESCALAAERYVFMCKEHEQAATYDVPTLKRLVALTIDVILHVVAQNHYNEERQPIKKERYVAEVHYDPIAKLVARFGEATLVRA
ncbi:MAG: P-type DNA transfer ATPase VirB11 [Nitrospira sp.]|nr:P-type DNA transfer ATPase VirB11 [Nitrospira sp.]